MLGSVLGTALDSQLGKVLDGELDSRWGKAWDLPYLGCASDTSLEIRKGCAWESQLGIWLEMASLSVVLGIALGTLWD